MTREIEKGRENFLRIVDIYFKQNEKSNRKISIINFAEDTMEQ